MKATDHLLHDHRLIRKVLEEFSVDHERFPSLLKTLSRTVIGHAWFEDEIFLPAFKTKGLIHKLFNDEIEQEHKDLKALLIQLNGIPSKQKKDLRPLTLQMQTILQTHLKKEEDALFPLAERILNEEGMNNLGAVMESRKTEIRDLVKDFY